VPGHWLVLCQTTFARSTVRKLVGACRPGRAAAGAPVLEVTGLRKEFGDLVAVDDVSFSLPPAGSLAIVGESGSGQGHDRQDDRGPMEVNRCQWPSIPGRRPLAQAPPGKAGR
jgi:hypothetical protein